MSSKVRLVDLLPAQSPVTRTMAELLDRWADAAETARRMLRDPNLVDIGDELLQTPGGLSSKRVHERLLEAEEFDDVAAAALPDHWQIGAWGLIRSGRDLIYVRADEVESFPDLESKMPVKLERSSLISPNYRLLLWVVCHLAVRDRNLLAGEQVRLSDGELPRVPEHRILRVSPEAIRAALEPLRPLSANWRAQTSRAAKSLSQIRVQRWHEPGWNRPYLRTWQPAATTWSGPARWVLSGKELIGRPREKNLGVLQECLDRGRGEDRQALYVSLTPTMWEALGPTAIDDSGRRTWGFNAVKAVRSEAYKLKGHERQERFAQAEKLKERSIYFQDSLALRVFSQGWTEETRRFAEMLIRERPGRSRRSDADSDTEVAPCNGTSGQGYSIARWRRLCWPQVDEVEGTRSLVRAIRILHEDLGLRVQLKAHPEWTTEDCLGYFDSRARRRRLNRQVVLFGLPRAQSDDGWAELFREHEICFPRSIVKDEAHGWDIRRRRKAVGFTQSDLASRVGVSAARISQWETGRERMSPDRYHELVQELRRLEENSRHDR